MIINDYYLILNVFHMQNHLQNLVCTSINTNANARKIEKKNKIKVTLVSSSRFQIRIWFAEGFFPSIFLQIFFSLDRDLN